MIKAHVLTAALALLFTGAAASAGQMSCSECDTASCPMTDTAKATASQTVTSAGESAAPTTAPTTQQSNAPINKFCAVTRDDVVDPKVTTTHNGKVIGFCCAGCIDDFKKDPEKYMKDLK